ncbi:protein S100-G-like isoform X7 [Dicentrarchus labrax]|uniref:protein S100-G-like isoform X1 n=1 Tax=Dicentrarchus labrax TaxID=13489 RepID=UPI0021F68F29|nr:protein S100-G-like isoform X1 [Dicentrarchus labrax]XP_051261806.1 protein S100-G-like isoform X2 [Dicentrarchus labrax]XP_051261809.1 protein S100-G-like isoform X4 [Dicentrarchus labrax]XP_051261810.1 protein S100-G-like isoform X5 [Dicentrarchus labrax]XP_051261812.1 protein S100-G-like isoform X7 [Dicentrarchus labrax]
MLFSLKSSLPLSQHWTFISIFATMSDIVHAMVLLRDTFERYAKRDGDKDTLTKSELTKLFRTEFPGTGHRDEAALDDFFSELDSNGDGVVDFTEFVTLLATLAELYTEY